MALMVLALLKMLETLVPDGASSLGGLVGDVVSEIVVVAVIPPRLPSSGLLLALGTERGDSGNRGDNGVPAHSCECSSLQRRWRLLRRRLNALGSKKRRSCSRAGGVNGAFGGPAYELDGDMRGVAGRLLGLMGRLIRFLLQKSIFVLRRHAIKPTMARIPTMTDTPMVTFAVEDTSFVTMALW
jgi:hypothetical protein